nr:DUF805 domain-containing protein [Acidobacteriota bacterium]
MPFIWAIQTGFRNYANFKGRAARASYWWWVLFSVLVQAATSGYEAMSNLISVALFLPSIAFGIRRMHDIDKRGWWILFPIVNLVFLLKSSTIGENRFGPPPPPRVV